MEKSVWASGQAYEPYVGRWSRRVAREFVEWLAVPPAARWLDVGCGTGALTETILRCASPSEVHGIAPSEGYLGLAREQVRDPRVRFDVGDARHLLVEPARCDAVVSALVLNFIPDLPAGLAGSPRPGIPVGSNGEAYCGPANHCCGRGKYVALLSDSVIPEIELISPSSQSSN
jgi:SAM-dependent methyltransferase